MSKKKKNRPKHSVTYALYASSGWLMFMYYLAINWNVAIYQDKFDWFTAILCLEWGIFLLVPLAAPIGWLQFLYYNMSDIVSFYTPF